MADTSAQADIRGINVEKAVKGFADENLMLKKFVTVSKTDATEIRWYQKTAGFLDTTDNETITASGIINAGRKSLPQVVEQSWTRNTSFAIPFKVESPLFTDRDLKDTDVDILATNIRDLTLGLMNQVDQHIYRIIADTNGMAGSPGDGSSVPSAAGTADGWDDDVTGNPILDILNAKESIRTYRYDPEGAIMLLHPGDYTSLINYLINVKGSSIPQFSSEKVRSGVVTEILGLRVVVSTSFTEDYAVIFTPMRTATYKQFMPLSSAVIVEPLLGKKIRLREEGVCLLHDPNSAYVITDIKV